MTTRRYSALDQLIIEFDRQWVEFRSPPPTCTSRRPYPAEGIEAGVLNESERRISEGLMRVNHAGEVSAQALYQGQKITSRDPEIREKMQRSADEEIDHLNWCNERLIELGGRTSYLGPFWYIGSFSIGTLAGMIGDKWSLGFVVETEYQVVKHLEGHLKRLPSQDSRSRAIVEQMKEDEAHHATVALHSGAAELPDAVRKAMGLASKLMTGIAYWV